LAAVTRWFAAGDGRKWRLTGSVTDMFEKSDDSVWVGIDDAPIPVDEAMKWASVPGCGAVVTFSGTVRDFSEGRPDVTSLEYETYTGVAQRRLREVADAARTRWPEVRRVALLHRVGTLNVGDVAVVVVASSAHRNEAFAAAQFSIDTLKETVPIWKRETWERGREWVLDSHPLAQFDLAADSDERQVSP
jgi:molybdopterin synthase catalytic subunit